MTDRKITEGAFNKGPLRKILNKQEYNAHLTAAGKERVEAAIKAGVQAEAKKFHLHYGVAGTHADAIAKFSTSKKYGQEDRRALMRKPKEQEVIKDSLDIFFKRKPAAPVIEEKVETPAPRVELKSFEVKPSNPMPDAANDVHDGEHEKAA